MFFKPFAQVTFTTDAGTFRWTQAKAGDMLLCSIKVGRKWKYEPRLHAVNSEQLGWHLRNLMQ